MSSQIQSPRLRGYHLDSLRAVALGFRPREPRPPWAELGFRRGASEGAWAAYEATPLQWAGITRTARRGRLLARLCGAGDAMPAELAEYDEMPEPHHREQERLMLLLEEAAFGLRKRLRASKPGLARAYGDLHWALDWLQRRLPSLR